MKRFIIIGHRASTDASFNLNDLCGSAGRLDVLIRSVGAGLLLSNDIRRDVEIYLLLQGKPRAPVCIRISGMTVRYLNPDERSTGALLRNALMKGDIPGGDFMESSPGIGIGSMDLDGVIEYCLRRDMKDGDESRLKDGDESRLKDGDESRLKGGDESRLEDRDESKLEDAQESDLEDSGVVVTDIQNTPRLFYLREDGDDMLDAATHESFIGKMPCFLLGDDRDLTPGEEKIVLARDPVILSLGPRALHTNQCITIVHNIIDRLEEQQNPGKKK